MPALHTGELVAGLFGCVTAIHAIVWAVFHCYKMYQDLYTMKRDSVNHRKNPPKISPIYRTMSWVTTISIVGYAGAVVSTAATSNFSVLHVSCKALTMINPIFWQIGKSFMFLTYILRLHQCYALSAFGYGKKKLYCMAVFVCLLTLILTIAIIIGVLAGPISVLDNDDRWPYHCAYKIHESWQGIAALGIIIFDIILTIGAIVAFHVPINRLFKALAATTSATSTGIHSLTNTRQKKMLYTGYKYKVCAVCASVTSLFWILLTLAGTDFGFVVQILAGTDWTINIFCLMLMTPYYPDEKYYRTLCFLCISCCDREKQSFQSSAVDLTSTKHTKTGSDVQPESKAETVSGRTAGTQSSRISVQQSVNSDLEKVDKDVEENP